jgi:hypothetical protein
MILEFHEVADVAEEMAYMKLSGRPKACENALGFGLF